MSKATAKSAPAKKAAAKASKAAHKPKTTTISDRAAEVESNLGGSQPLRDFLTEVGWS